MYYNTQERIIYCFDINGKMKSYAYQGWLYTLDVMCASTINFKLSWGFKMAACRRKDALDWKHMFSYNTGLNNDYMTH